MKHRHEAPTHLQHNRTEDQATSLLQNNYNIEIDRTLKFSLDISKNTYLKPKLSFVRAKKEVQFKFRSL